MKKLSFVCIVFLLSLFGVTASETVDSVKVVALLGDSMTWIGGDNCEKETGWTYHLKKSFPNWTIKPYARSGATWTNTVATKGDVSFYSEILCDENVVYDQVLRLINDVDSGKLTSPDVIIAFAGGNDAWFEERRPGIYEEQQFPTRMITDLQPSEVTTLAGSIELCCKMLQNRFPNARIVLITPPEMSKTSPDRIHKVSRTMSEVADSLGLEVLRADNELPFKHDVEKSDNRIYTYDGAHSNPKGAQTICNYVIAKLGFIKK